MGKQKPIYSKCMLCGRVRRKGDTTWLPASIINEAAVALSHGYCSSCYEIVRTDLEKQCEEFNKQYAV